VLFQCVDIIEMLTASPKTYQYCFVAMAPPTGQTPTFQLVTNSPTSYTVGSTYTLTLA
jgi:hypothetical protein